MWAWKHFPQTRWAEKIAFVPRHDVYVRVLDRLPGGLAIVDGEIETERSRCIRVEDCAFRLKA
jgi:hypothetical protein